MPHETSRGAADSWSRLECELIVRDYLDMLNKEMRGGRYSKTGHRENLRSKLNNRSDGSVEYKHQNISAIMLESGFPYILGYKPAFNYQSLLREVTLAQLNKQLPAVVQGMDAMIETVPEDIAIVNWEQVRDTPPELLPTVDKDRVRQYEPRQYDYSEREARNRLLGEKGEEFVLEFEQHRLSYLGRHDLAEEVEWTGKVRGDGVGYDIRSFKGEEDIELFIEVKTTNSGKYQPFMISENEVACSSEYDQKYALYRVFEFKHRARLFMLPGSIRNHVHLFVNQYQASFK